MSESSAARIFSSLVGNWRLWREITGYARMSGLAQFTETAPDLLRYREEGKLTLSDGALVHAHREYFYRLHIESIEICFAENGWPGAIFHTLEFADVVHGSCRCIAVHHCGQDIYTGTYTFERDRSFSIEISIQGPTKSRFIRSEFLKWA